MSLTHYVHTLNAPPSYTSTLNEKVKDLLLEQLAEKHPGESAPVLKRELAKLMASLCVNEI